MNKVSTRQGARNLLIAAIAIGAVGAATQAQAATATTTLNVTASVADSCLIAVTAPMTFGAYDPISANASAPLEAIATLTTTCTGAAGGSITLGQGINAIGATTDAVPLRRMADGGGTNFLSYFLYTNTGRTQVWGNTAPSGLGVIGDGTARSVSVYGRVPGGQTVLTGSYADTVIATITY